MPGFPSEKELKKMRKLLSKVEGSRMLAPDASPADKMKFSICEQFVIYRRENKLTQRQLAEQIGIDEALMSKLLRYYFDEFTIDRLVGYLAILFPKAKIEILIKNKAA